MRPLRAFVLSTLAFALLSTSAGAQVVGTFKWQTQPYCNVVTLTLVQQGGMYQLTGVDDLCGGGAAPVTGTAVVTGGVAMGFAVALPSGRAAHLTATLTLPSASGSWTDADGNSGTFLLTNGGGAGSTRPAPAITVTQLSPAIYGGTGAASTVARSDHDHDSRYYTKAQSDAAKPAAVTTGIVGGPGTPFSFAAEGQVGFLQTVTTDRPGRWLLTKMFVGGAACTSAPDERLIFLTVDGVAVRTSAVYTTSSGAQSTRLAGVSDVVIPAGVHTVAVGAECATSTAFGVTGTAIANLAVVVIP